MNFFQNIIDTAKKKTAEMQERKQFLSMVEQETRPIKRAAYLKQMMQEAVGEGIAKAKADAAAKQVKQQKPEDYGIKAGLNDPMKFLNGTKSQENKK